MEQMIRGSNFKKLLIITDIGFSKRDYERFGLEQIKKDFDLEIWDFTELFNSNFFKRNNEKTYSLFEKYKKIQSFEEFYKLVEISKPKFAFDYMGSSMSAFKTRSFLQKNKVKVIKWQAGLMPEIKRTFSELIYKFYNNIFKPSSIKRKIYSLVNKNSFKYDILIVTGKKGINEWDAKNAKNIIYGHTINYEKYLHYEVKNNFTGNYFVFLDQYLPFHSYQYYRNVKPICTKENYYNSINKFFEYFEKTFKQKIIISAHPRSTYEEMPKIYGSREIIKNKTFDLIKNSNGVLAHTSTAISVAVLFRKPLIFLTTDEIRSSFDDFRIDSLSRDLSSTLVNVDNSKSFIKLDKSNNINNVDEYKYKKFEESFIKHPNSDKKSIWDIFPGELKKLDTK